MDFIRIFNVSFQIWGTVLSLIILIFLVCVGRYKQKIEKLCISLIISNMLILLMDALAFYYRGRTGIGADIGVRLSNGLQFVFSSLLSCLFLMYVKEFIEYKSNVRLMHVYKHTAVGFMLFSIAIILYNQVQPLIYQIGEDNLYVRLPGYALIMITPIVTLTVSLVLIIRYCHKMSFYKKVPFYLYIATLFIGILASTWKYGVVYSQISTTFAIIIMFLHLMLNQSKNILKQEREQNQNTMDVFMNQMGSHFLYNVLGTLSALCELDQNLAAQSINKFAQYLRSNMNSLSAKEPVPFYKELEHIRTYVDLEMLRFGESLNVQYEMETEDFYIPTLSIQSLVESAIHHGMNGKEGICNIWITTVELDEENVEIVIKDDGMGFDVSSMLKDEKEYLGLLNAKKRIECMVGGTVTIESIKEMGTKVTVVVPGGTRIKEEFVD